DQGAGIGRVEWRVNGVTVAVADAKNAASQSQTLQQLIALDAGENTIEVVAYNGRNLLASSAQKVSVTWPSSKAAAKPNLYVLAVGIDDYHDPGYRDAATGTLLQFSPLSFAVGDAEAVGAALKEAAKGVYGNVEVVYARNAEATLPRLEAIVDRLAEKV